MAVKVYVLFAHHREEINYSILAASSDVSKIMKACEEENIHLDYKEINNEELTEELIASWDSQDFNYDLYGERIALATFDVEIPENWVMFGLLGNGYKHFDWRGELMGMYASMDEAIKMLLDKSEFDWKTLPDVKEDFEYIKNQLTEHDYIMDDMFTHWKIMEISIS